MKPDLTHLTLSTAREQLIHRDYSAQELTEACLYQIERYNPLINAFITITPELAVQGAMLADGILAEGRSNLNPFQLTGIPVAIKDLFDVGGVPTSAGSKFFKEHLPEEDACVVSRLRDSGGVILGKTNTHEIALGVTGVNPHFGAVRNPWDTSCISGGSSSGSAAAVAAGMCLAAIGTDTGGSIRIPAALCGVVGLKPTYGRVSARGVIPLSWNLDHIGTLTHSVRDAAVLLSVMAGYDSRDPASKDIAVDDYGIHLEEGVRDWRIALAAGDYIEAAESEVLLAVDAAGELFNKMGARVEKVDISWLAECAQANGRMVQADAAAFHRERLVEHPDWFGPDVLQRLHNGSALPASEYALALRLQSEARRRFEVFFKEYDILLLPTTPTPAPSFERISALEAALSLTRFTSSFNLTGLPALTLPCGFSKGGLPIGLQIVSRHWGEGKIFQAGHAYEQATEWHLRRPNI